VSALSFNAPGEREKSLWLIKKENDPAHSQWYIDRFKAMEAEGKDMAGGGRLGGGFGARGGEDLGYALGHRVTGVDIDPELIDEARRVCPEATWVTADLVDLPQALGIESDAGEDGFELIVCAGNVMGFLARSTRKPVLENFRKVLAPGGRAVIGYGSGPGRDYAFAQFLEDAREVGLNVDSTFSSWDLRPFAEGSEFIVAVLSR